MKEVTFGGEHQSGRPARPLWQAMLNGFRARCPRCGEGRVFSSFLGAAHECADCGEEMHHHRADDLPAYLVIAIVGHIVVAGFMAVEMTTYWPMWLHLVVWLPLTIILALTLLQPIKGAVIGLQWAFYMHGFGGEPDHYEEHPEA